MKNLDFINNSGSLSIENFVLSNDSVPVNNLSSNERPIFMSEFAQRLVSRGWNIPIRRKVSTSGSSTDLSIVPDFCDDKTAIDVTKGVYKVKAGPGVQLGSNRIIPQEQITRFTENYYSNVLGGNLQMVKEFIETAAQFCHVELTTLIVPGENDTEEEMRAISEYISQLKDKNGNVIGHDIPLHISRFFPRFKMTDRNPTDVKLVYHLADIAREKLNYVYEGNC